MTLYHTLSVALTVWLSALAAVLLYKALTGQINTRGLLTIDGQQFSIERLQLLIVTVGMLTYYANAALETHKIPNIPDSLVTILAGSNLFYAGRKFIRKINTPST